MQLFRNQARTAKNADADRTADTDRETEADAENASKVTGLLGHHSSGQRKPTARRSQSKPILTPRCPRTVPLADLVWRNNHLHRHRDKSDFRVFANLHHFAIAKYRNISAGLHGPPPGFAEGHAFVIAPSAKCCRCSEPE